MNGSVRLRAALTEADRESMFGLLGAHFDDVARDQFELDLSQKDWVVLLHDEASQLAGFSTIQLYETRACGREISVVYSGDTIVRPDAWRSPALARNWIQAIRSLDRDESRDLYWLLICSGWRTYRFLPTFWHEYFPRYDQPVHPWQQLAQELAQAHFGNDYDAEQGIVRFARPTRLRRELGAVRERNVGPHVRYFEERNPEHARGDELVCLTHISDDNLTAAGRRMIRPDLATHSTRAECGR